MKFNAAATLLVFLGVSGVQPGSAAPSPFPWLHSVVLSPQAQLDAWQGESVAADGDRIVVGAPYEDRGAADSGVVRVYDAVTHGLLHEIVNPSPGTEDYFGDAVAISGSIVVVGASFDDARGENAGAVYIYDLAGATPGVPVWTLHAPTPAVREFFGVAVAISGPLVVVGMRANEAGLTDAGHVYVYDLSRTTPTLPRFSLANPTPQEIEYFGSAVAISGNRVVVGAYGEHTFDWFVGEAYVFDLTRAVPGVPLHVLVNPNPVETDYFGNAVAISGNLVAVGSRFDDTAATNSGTVYVYNLLAPSPTAPALLVHRPQARGYESFGVSVALSGSILAVTAHRDNAGATNAGAAFVFNLAASTPTIPFLVLTNPAPAPMDLFGRSVALAGSRIVVGAPNDDTGAIDAGSAYVYDLLAANPGSPVAVLAPVSVRPGGQLGTSVSVARTWLAAGAPWHDVGAGSAGCVGIYNLAGTAPDTVRFLLVNPTPAENDLFGAAVSMSGSRVLVGAPQDDARAPNSGLAYLYDIDRASPDIPLLTLTNPAPADGDMFGMALALAGSTAVIGVPFDDTGAVNAGMAFVYDTDRATPTVPLVVLTNPAPEAYDVFGSAIAISDRRVVVGAYLDSAAGLNTGSVYVYDLASATPALPFLTLTNPAPAAQDRFGFAVSISGPRVAVGAYLDDAGNTDAGSVSVFDLNSPDPRMPVLTLTNPLPQVSGYFGRSVALSGSILVAGAYGAHTGATRSGLVVAYDLSAAVPGIPVAVLTNPTPALNDDFGWSVAIDGLLLAGGARLDDTSVTDGGAVHVFGLVPPALRTARIGAQIEISWVPTNTGDFILQGTDRLSGIWMNEPTGGTNPARFPATNAARLYRLIKPGGGL